MKLLLLCFLLTAIEAAAQPTAFPVAAEKGRTVLKITGGAVSGGCAWGEINAFEQEAAPGRKSFRLLVSFEPIHPLSFPLRAVDLASFDLKKEFTSSLMFPPVTEKTYMTVAICSDWEHKDKCAGKPLAPLPEYFAGNDVRSKEIKIAGEPRKDEIFYFAVVALDGNGGTVVQAEALPPEIKEELSAKGVPPQRLAEMNRTLGVFSQRLFSGSSNGLRLTFHFRDRSKCAE